MASVITKRCRKCLYCVDDICNFYLRTGRRRGCPAGDKCKEYVEGPRKIMNIKEILDKHKKWLLGEGGGERADLCDADLCSADLRGADLRGANLCSADLRGADLRGLPALAPTNVVEPIIIECASGAREPRWHMETMHLPPKERSKARSKTFPGIARAMAEQWGGICND